MSGQTNLSGEQFSGTREWHQAVLDPDGPLRASLRESELLKAPRRAQQAAQGRVANYCAGCGNHTAVNPATYKCPTCTDKAYARMANRS